MIELYRGDAKRIQHFCKVHSYAKLIAETENVDKKCLFTIEAAALTHDIGIHFCEEKYGNCNGKLQEKEGPAIAHHHTYNNIDEIFQNHCGHRLPPCSDLQMHCPLQGRSRSHRCDFLPCSQYSVLPAHRVHP